MYYLGVDGGGTKTKFVLCDEHGNVVAEETKPTCHYLQVGFEGVTKILNEGIDSICLKANINRQEITSAFIGAPGYGDVQSDAIEIEKAIDSAFMDIKHAVGNDGENALAGALCGKEGINIVAGTGSIGFGYNSNTGITENCGGWYHAIGSDEGSGYWISYQLLHEFTRQSDGRDDKTALYYKLKDYLNFIDDGEVIKIVVEDWKLDRTKFASLSKLIPDLLKENDYYACKIVDDAANELSQIIKALYKNLKFEGIVDVSYTGGVFNLKDSILNPLRKYLPEDKFNLVSPALGPDCGSLLLAFRNNNAAIDSEIIENIKKSIN